jgi:hypothetical protein
VAPNAAGPPGNADGVGKDVESGGWIAEEARSVVWFSPILVAVIRFQSLSSFVGFRRLMC